MNMIVDKKLIDKYNESGPRYTSYPPATFFNEYFNDNEYLECLSKSNYENPKNISVYIHVPFCPQICHFCGCTTETGFTKPFLERYINAVVKEIELVSSKLDDKRKLTQVHWGGGTPNAISYKYIEKITNTLKDYFDFSKNYEMAIECNPAHLEFRHIELLKKFGFNRISVGIQDFRNDVLDAINRKPSKRPIEEIIKNFERLFNSFSDTSDITKPIKKARKLLKKNYNKKEEALALINEAKKIYNFEKNWRLNGNKIILSDLIKLSETGTETFGLRKQDKLNKEQAIYLASCKSVHEDISLYF